jgi:CHAT domain-containing protein
VLVGRAAWIRGLAAFGLNEFAAARLAYEEMLSSAAARGDVDQWMWACGLLANVHFTLGDSVSAWRYRIDAARRSDEAFSPSVLGSLLTSAAGDAAARGYHSTALLFQSLVLSNAATSANLEVQLRSQRARSLYALGRHVEAERELTRAAARLAAITDVESRHRVEADLLAAEADIFRESNQARAIAAAQRALSLPVAQSDLLRRARLYLTLGEGLLGDGQLLRAADAVASGIEVLEAYRAHPAVEFTIRDSDGVWDLYRRAAQIAMRRGDVGRAFAYNERGRVRTPQERRTWGAKTASLDDLQRVLPANTALAVLTQFGDRLQIWVVRRDDVVSQALSMTSSRAAGLIAAHLREMVQQAPTPAATAELYTAVFAPLETALAGIQNVVVVADAPYNRIAFAGLWDQQSNRYVVERHGIVLAPSATAYKWALNQANPRSRADVERRASVLRPRPEHPTRADAVVTGLRAAYGSERIEQLEALTATRFVDAVARGDVIHIEGTLVPNDEFSSLSSITVDEEPGHRYSGAVFARSFADATARATLVTLETSHPTGSNTLGEGALGFARALIAAGVPAVVSPVTAVAESSVEQTWLEFHRRYAAGATAADSLRRAQIDALNDSARRPGPWATLTVFGSAQ